MRNRNCCVSYPNHPSPLSSGYERKLEDLSPDGDLRSSEGPNTDSSPRVENYTDEPAASPSLEKPELEWLSRRLIERTGVQPAEVARNRPLRAALDVARRSSGDHAGHIRRLARGLDLMAHNLFRAALVEFETVLAERPSDEFEPISELALEAHAFGLLRLGCRHDAREEFEHLVRDKLRHERQYEEPAPTATLVGLLRVLETAG